VITEEMEVIALQLFHLHVHFNSHFWGEPGLAGCPVGSLHANCSGRKPFGDNLNRCIWAGCQIPCRLPVTQPAVLKHWRSKETALLCNGQFMTTHKHLLLFIQKSQVFLLFLN